MKTIDSATSTNTVPRRARSLRLDGFIFLAAYWDGNQRHSTIDANAFMGKERLRSVALTRVSGDRWRCPARCERAPASFKYEELVAAGVKFRVTCAMRTKDFAHE
jgi:hypothetical protein